MIRSARNARRDMIVNEVGHTVCVDETIASGEIDTRLPFLGRHVAADRFELGRVVHGMFPKPCRAVSPPQGGSIAPLPPAGQGSIDRKEPAVSSSKQSARD